VSNRPQLAKRSKLRGGCGLTLRRADSYNPTNTMPADLPERGNKPIAFRSAFFRGVGIASAASAMRLVAGAVLLASAATPGFAAGPAPAGSKTAVPATSTPIKTTVPVIARAPGRSSLGATTPSASIAVAGTMSGAFRAASQDMRGVSVDYVPAEARFDTLRLSGVLYTRVSMPGAVVVEQPGRPALPMATVHVAVPDGMSPRLHIAAEQWNERSGPPPPMPVTREQIIGDDPKTGPMSKYTTEPDPQVYGRINIYPAQEVELGRGAVVGEMWVVPVHVHPIRWDPRERAYKILQSMTLRVDFVPATDAERASRPVLRPGGDAGAWSRVQQTLVKNYETAKAFPFRPKSAPRPAAVMRSSLNPEFKISVRATGWTAVSYAALSAAGFPAGVPIANITVSQRGWDDVADAPADTLIPVVPRDANSNGTFDAGDEISFYGRSLKDRVATEPLETRYTDANVYWLTWSSSAATPIGTISGSLPGPVITPTSFRDTIHMEQDKYMLASPNPSVTSPPEAIDYFFWTSGNVNVPDQFAQTIPFVDPDASQPFRIRSYYQGQNGAVHRLNIYYQSSTGTTDTLAANQMFFDQDVYVLDTGLTIPGSLIGPGTNQYKHFGDHQPPIGGAFQTGSLAWLDWVDVIYSRLYKANGGGLQFTSGDSLGVVEIHLTGFPGTNVEIYDVTDPVHPLAVTGVTINGAPGPPFDATFRTDTSAGPRRFVAVIGYQPAEVQVAAADIHQDVPSNLSVPGAFGAGSLARSIIIAPQAFLTPANRLADYRRGQGYVVEVTDIQDVYDEFNGGIKSARAIRRYLRHAYLTWTPRPTFVILAGDGSMDYQHHLATSGVDWIPTYLRFESIPGPPGAELVAQEAYYSINLSAAALNWGADLIPSVFFARIPASNASELDLFVSKEIQYENFQPTDTWRGHQLLVSDDEFSSGIFGVASYCHSDQEQLFKLTNTDFGNITHASQSGQDITNDSYDLKTFTDPVPTFDDGFGNSCRNLLSVETQLNQVGGGYDTFANDISQGSLLTNIETHANRYVLAHEQIYCVGSIFCSSPVGPDRVQNQGRPTFLMVWGCHANQFPDGPWLAQGATDSTKSIGEQWLFLDSGRGSIASVGSTAYEFLQTNSTYNLYVADAFYTFPPAPTPPPGQARHARWILGEVFGVATIRNGGTFADQAEMNYTVNLLGDPMLHMDALPPRIFQVTLNGGAVTDDSLFTSDSPTDSVTIIAKARDEAGLQSISLAERDLASGTVTPIDSTLYSVAFADTGRQITLTGRARPHVGNYDLQVRAIDTNGRLQIFTLEVRTPIRYLANGIPIVNGVFVEAAATLRAEVTTPIPVTADSLTLLLDGVVVPATKSQLDIAGRKWALETESGDRNPGSHTLQVAIGGRTAGLDQATFQISSEFTMRGVAVVSPRMQGAGCGGSIFQYELSGPANKVDLLLLTVAGRRVSSLQLPGSAGLNVFCWDGRDSEGHETATGLYLFRIRATDATGRTVSQDGRMIRSR